MVVKKVVVVDGKEEDVVVVGDVIAIVETKI